MGESKFNSTVESLFKGMDSFITSKTVVGDVVHINDTIIIPLIDVAFGVAAGASSKSEKNNSMGGLGGKMKPSAVLVINNGITKMIPVNQEQDLVSKLIDLVPEVVQKFNNKDKKVDKEVEQAVENMIKED